MTLELSNVECLQFLGGKRDELAATVFVPLDDLRLIDLLARSRIMWPDRDRGNGLGLIGVIPATMSAKVRHQRLGKLFPSRWLQRLVLSLIRRRRSPYVA